ncbi:MAG TPA: MotA/TolQ/ExbB proton channel family protein [Myxococcota bacterium]|jgi:biopolymer transport protein ExbB|nr:MotA/TolQ/ExbB proton channel family protein [Myxococcota bacterium]
MLESFAKFLKDGGPFMYVNVFNVVIVLAIIIDRVIAIVVKNSLSREAFMRHILRMVANRNFDRALKLCNAAPRAALAKVVKAGLQRANKGEAVIIAAIDAAILDVTPGIKTRVGVLWAMANIATLVGLIGTVTGLIGAFQAIGLAAPEQRAALLSGGISEAMNNTAFGLSIAVTSIVAHVLISGAAKKLVEDLERYSVVLENALLLHDDTTLAA